MCEHGGGEAETCLHVEDRPLVVFAVILRQHIVEEMKSVRVPSVDHAMGRRRWTLIPTKNAFRRDEQIALVEVVTGVARVLGALPAHLAVIQADCYQAWFPWIGRCRPFPVA